MGRKLCTSLLNLAFDTLPCQSFKCLASRVDKCLAKEDLISANKTMGKFSAILTMPLRYFGRNKHFKNWFEMKSFYNIKLLLISYHQQKFHVTGMIFTM